MLSREGVTDRDSLSMIAYGVGILPVINNLIREITDFTQPCYTDDNVSLCTFTIIDTYFNSLIFQGPVHRYYPEPSKSILIVHPDNFEAGKVLDAQNVRYARVRVISGVILGATSPRSIG